MNSHHTEEKTGRHYFNLLEKIFGDNNYVLPYNLVDKMDLVYEIDLILREIEETPPTRKQNPDVNIRRKNVLVLRFGLASGSEPMTLQEIANKLNLTDERIRQIEYQGLKAIRNPKNRKKLDKFRNIEFLQNS